MVKFVVCELSERTKRTERGDGHDREMCGGWWQHNLAHDDSVNVSRTQHLRHLESVSRAETQVQQLSGNAA